MANRGRAHLAWKRCLGLGSSWSSGMWACGGQPLAEVFRSSFSMHPEEQSGPIETHTLPTGGSGAAGTAGKMAPEPPCSVVAAPSLPYPSGPKSLCPPPPLR